MPVVLTGNITCELGPSNDTEGICRELVYDDQEYPAVFKVKNEVFPSSTVYVRNALYALVKINTSQVETNLDDLHPKTIPISLVKKEFIISIKQVFGRLLDVKQTEAAYNE